MASYRSEKFVIQDNMGLVMACQQIIPRSRDCQTICTKGRMTVDQFWCIYIALLQELPQYNELRDQVYTPAQIMDASRRIINEIDTKQSDEANPSFRDCEFQIVEDSIRDIPILVTLIVNQAHTVQKLHELLSPHLKNHQTLQHLLPLFEVDILDEDFGEYVRLECISQLGSTNKIRLVKL